MLSERQLEELLKIFQARTQKVTEEYLKRMGEHLRDIGTLSRTDVHRLIQLKRANANIEAVKREIARMAEKMIEDVEDAFLKIAESDAQFAREIFATDHAPPVKYAPGTNLSAPLERILKAQLRITQQEMANLSQTTIDSTLYREAVDTAVQIVQTGATDYTSAIRKAMKAAAADGLKVEYPSGYSRRLDTAVRQNILDGVRALNQDVLEQIGKDYRADGVEISAHALCAEDHLPYQGRQYTKKEFERIQNNLYRRFGIWNCKHTWYPILIGITEPAYTEDELEQYIRNSSEEVTIGDRTMSRYKWTQEQRKIETAVRAQKDIAVAAKAEGDMMARREAQRRINRLQAIYAEISKAAGVEERPDKMTVSGFRRVKATDELKKTGIRAKMSQEELRDIETRELIKSSAVDKTVNVEKQNRHIISTDEYDGKRSYIYGNIESAQRLVDRYHGTGQIVFNRKGEWNHKEVVQADSNIGVNKDKSNGAETPTNRFVIHYSNTGTHIVPTMPKE